MNNEDIEFKNYPIEYEKVFSGRRINQHCDVTKVSAFNDIPGNPAIYIKMFRDSAKKFQDDLFDNLVKLAWLRSRFCYNGKHRLARDNGWWLERAYGIFMRKYVGLSSCTIFFSRVITSPIVSYFKDFFPNFVEGNPFEEKYEYPFKYMSLDCILLVNIMPERMYLLRHGEKNKMEYVEFMDYVINYTKCYNEEHDDKHEFVFSQNNFNFIRHLKAFEEYKPRKKRKVYKILNEKIYDGKQ